jgi:hypothetical protein
VTNCACQKKIRKLSLARAGNTVILAGVPKMRFAVEVKYHEEHGGGDSPVVLMRKVGGTE